MNFVNRMMSSEATPLTASTVPTNAPHVLPTMGGSSGHVSEMNRFVSQVFSSENLQRARGVAHTQLDELKRSMSDGDFSMRFLALLAGVTLFLHAVTGLVFQFLTLHWAGAVMELYAAALGSLMILLESRRLHLPEHWMAAIYKYALFLKFVWGRGALYVVAGTIQLAQGGSGWMDWIVGGGVVLVGLLFVWVGRQTAKKLQELHGTLSSEQTLQSKFREADVGGTGKLTLEEFKTLIASLGMKMNRPETEAAFLHMARDDAGEVSYQDFRSWWAEWDDSAGSSRALLV